jgi:hypothetical protein
MLACSSIYFPEAERTAWAQVRSHDVGWLLLAAATGSW